ncbi:MAG: ABC transporter permease subunit [Ruminococcus sp.]|nr:ABC transporter permease subunit [Ruminococcus sp.]MDE6426884.1 ABC transporter permease subunit [Ruminococcus sp.]MDE6500828.1 ABC transporter permease subunit [Ruminococcus sp.]
MKRYITIIKLILPVIAVFLSVATYYGFDDSGKQKSTEYPYYVYLMLFVSGIYFIFAIASIFMKTLRAKIIHKAPLLTGTIIFMAFVNIVTAKTTILPTLYFPSLDRIIGLIYEQKLFLLENVFFSLKLLITGFIWGASIGFLTGLALGYSKKVGYWLNPVTKFIGPIPTTAWIPLALSVFPTTNTANVFLIAFAVWFPVTLMTSSGIQSTNQVHFEVSSTLGASTLYKIIHVAIPSAMPSIFLGVFYGTVSSFATLMAVEMNGNSSGIGWYINWQKQVMMYDGVYAGLIIIAVLCSLILTLLFKVRDRVLVWQKGVIKW